MRRLQPLRTGHPGHGPPDHPEPSGRTPAGQRWVVGKDFEAYYEAQKMHVSELLGKIDPQCLEEYQDYDGYKGLRSFYSQGFDSFLQKVVAAGFCEFTRTTSLPSAPPGAMRVEKQRPILVVNAAPAFPPGHRRYAAAGGLPHQVMEGILLAVKTLQAEAVIVYLPADATLARERLRSLDKANESRILPDQPLASEHYCRESRFMVEDEDLFIRSCTRCCPGPPGEIRRTPPSWSIAWAPSPRCPSSPRRRSPWFRKLGIACAPGTMIFRLMGAVEHPGFVEVAMSSTLGDVINGPAAASATAASPRPSWWGAPGGHLSASPAQAQLEP